jgi:hypothetical protein
MHQRSHERSPRVLTTLSIRSQLPMGFYVFFIFRFLGLGEAHNRRTATLMYSYNRQCRSVSLCTQRKERVQVQVSSPEGSLVQVRTIKRTRLFQSTENWTQSSGRLI